MPSLKDIFGGGFRPDDHQPAKDFEILDPGKYTVQIEEAEVKETRAGNGHYLRLQMVVIDGDRKNRKLWDNINLDNPSQQCVQIGKGELSALGKALGFAEIDDEAQLLNGIVVAHVKAKGDQNEIRTYSAVGSTETSTPSVQQPTQPTSAAPSGKAPATPKGTPPWAR